MPNRVLIVDESPLLREGLKAILASEAGLIVCAEAGTGQEALRLADELRPDLVVMDLSLPDSAGLDLIRRLKARAPAIRILICCLHDEGLFAQRALRAGALGFVGKQEPTGQLVAAVQRVLAGRVYLSHQMVERVVDGLAGRRPHACPTVGGLSDREFEVFGLIGQGLATGVIAKRLGLSVKTVESHRERIKRKLGVTGSAQLAKSAVHWSLEAT